MNELVQPLQELKPEAFDWLWPNNLAFGNLALLDGDPGLGKSLVSLDLCARLTTGRPFPGADAAPEPASAIILNAEDNALQVVLPRLAAAGADLARVHVLRQDYVDNHGGFCLPGHTAALAQALKDTSARLVVIDPITAFLDPGVVLCSDQSVRAMLRPLARLAMDHHALILLIRHMNKTLGTLSIYRGLGSIAFQGSCRSSWLLGRDPVDKQRNVMAQVKTNYGPMQPSLAFEIVGRDGTAAVTWHGISKFSGNQVLTAAGLKPDLPGKAERAGDFLVDFLQNGPRLTREIWPAARKLGLREGTVRVGRKKRDIKIYRTYVGGQQVSYWHLPEHEPPRNGALDAVHKLLRPIIEKYPATPID